MCHCNDWDLSKSGPVIILTANSGETVITMQVCYTQANLATCVLTIWEIDSQVSSECMTGTNDSWPEFWEKFLDLVPVQIAPAVARCEMQVKF
jgi:hypothetical protein